MHFFAWTGHFGYDDIYYAKLSNNLLSGDIDYGDHYSYRWPILFITAISYFIGGVNNFTSAIPSLLIFSIVILITNNILKEKRFQVKLVGLSFISFNYWFIHYADKIMPDIYIALSVLGFLFFYYKERFSSSEKTIKASMGIVLMLLFGFISKGTIILLTPTVLYLILNDVIKKRFKLWLSSGIIGVLVITAYFGITYLLTGNVFARFTAIADNSYVNPCSYDILPNWVLLDRLFISFFELMFRAGLIVPFIFVIPGYFISSYIQSEKTKFWANISFILLLSSNFMSISASDYVPMCIDSRHYLFLIPVFSIAAAFSISDFVYHESKIIKNRYLYLIFSIFIIFSLIDYLKYDSEKAFLYLPFVLTLSFYTAFKNKNNMSYFASMIILALLFVPGKHLLKAKTESVRENDKLIKTTVLNYADSLEKINVVTDPVQANILNYELEFIKNPGIEILTFDSIKNKKSDELKNVLFILNHRNIGLSNYKIDSLPYYMSYSWGYDTCVSKSNLKVFYSKNLPKKKEFIQYFTDFESKENIKHPENIIKDSYTNDSYYKVKEFSGTFEYEFMPKNKSTYFIVNMKVKFHADAKPEAYLVFSIDSEKNSSNNYYKGISFDEFYDSCSYCSKVETNFNLKYRGTGKSILKAYVWNTKNKCDLLIDDFKLQVEIVK